MATILVGVSGQLAGTRFPLGEEPITFGRGPDNDVRIDDPEASRLHAEIRREAGGWVVRDLGSANGTEVNGRAVTDHVLQTGDEIRIADEVFRFQTRDAATLLRPDDAEVPGVLRVAIAGGGPVGMSFALLLDHLMGPAVSVSIHDGRWRDDGDRVVWARPEEGNNRRQQVVTIQSRQFLKLPPEVQQRLFTPGNFTEMWPAGPDSIQGFGPRNIRIAYVEDQLLALVNEKARATPERFRLVPEAFDPDDPTLRRQHVLAICEGGRSTTREHFGGRFGVADINLYGLDGHQVQDMVLGLRVKSDLPDPMSVLLTVSQNRFLLNSLRGEGFLNMRLTDQEAQEAVGINPVLQQFTPCIQSAPCLLERRSTGEFWCSGHKALFLPALLKGSALWDRVLEGLRLFGVAEQNLTGVTGFRLDMVQRPRFTAQLFPHTARTPGTYGFLLGDAANSIHFWPGRGLNSGLASATSLARCLATTWHGTPFRDADFTRHEAVMSMLQYRHKTRAFRQMVTTDDDGDPHAIKDLIARGITEGEHGTFDGDTDAEVLMARLVQIRGRLAPRLEGLPDDDTLRRHLQGLAGATVHTLVMSEPWDSGTVGGEEVDVDWLLPEPQPAARPEAAAPAPVAPAQRQPEVPVVQGWAPTP